MLAYGWLDIVTFNKEGNLFHVVEFSLLQNNNKKVWLLHLYVLIYIYKNKYLSNQSLFPEKKRKNF